MPFNITFLEKNNVVVIENNDEITYEELIEQTQEAIELSNNKNSKLFLTDFTHVNIHVDIWEIFQFPIIYEESGMNRLSKIAVIVSGKGIKTEEMQFYETICYNRGWQIKIFLKKKPALEWLEKYK